MGAFVIPSIFTAVDKFTSPVRGMGRELHVFADKADAAISRNERLFKKLTPAISETSKQFLSFASTAAIASAAVAGAAFSGKSIIDYETELANLQAVTGATGKDFDLFKSKIKDVAVETKSSAVNVAQAFTAIANNQPELLKDAAALAAVTKGSIILAQASKMELKPAGEALTQILNQYGKGAEYAAKAVDILAAGSVAGSSEIRDTADAIQKFGTVAANAGIKIDESVALIELASKFEKGAEAGQKLRNILITMSTAKVQDPKAVKDMQRLGVNMAVVSNATLPLNTRLTEMAKIAKDDAAIFHVFGKENQALATGVLSNVNAFDDMMKAVGTESKAAEMAAKNNSTLARVVEQLKDKFVTWLVTSDEAAKALNILKKVTKFVSDNLSAILKFTGLLIGAFVIWKGLILASRAALFLYNIALGINAALTGQSAFATMGSNVAYAAFRGTILATTAAQWALNTAMLANPIAWVVLGVMALVAALGYVIANYRTIESLHSEQLSKNKAKAIQDETDAVRVQAALYEKSGNTKAEAQRKAVRDAKKLIVDDLTGMKAQLNAAKTDSQRRVVENRMATVEGRLAALNNPSAIFSGAPVAESAQAINPKSVEQEAFAEFMQTTNNAKVDINIKDPNNRTQAESNSNFVNIRTTSTMGE